MRWWSLRVATIRNPRVGGERGQSAIEFVFMLPFILLMLFMVIEATSALRSFMLLEDASREGARYAAVGQAGDACAKVAATFGHPLDACTVTSIPPDPSVRVSVTYTYQFQTPLLSVLSFVTGGTISNVMSMSAQTTMRQE